ncbi:14529_t:CDS:2 [Entrophospora sp. SA101]|nr:14529_t:CDS:2 [Entrophospora sp. SA101]CAJ0838590.1 9379_t:CDS:2 [Entrophospora sp. SA101]CAJ0908378.1 5863_t:CDS:2 [Entrophospora sp. SA101]CAJ0912225.1 18238_t:CDS:2 [Entrophospora sp. SA101]CAJ0927520.1 9252_t:CDS:2 [Entrophospora sp. SA101]
MVKPEIITDNVAVIKQHDKELLSLLSFLSTTNMLQVIESIQAIESSSSFDNTEIIKNKINDEQNQESILMTMQDTQLEPGIATDNIANERNGNDYSSSFQSLLSAIDTDILQAIVLLSLKNIEEFKASYSKKDLNCSSIDFSSNEKECLSNENGNSNDNSSVIELPQSHCYQQLTLTHLKSLNHYL